MPELPEVETVRRGIAAGVVGRRIEGVELREPRLRWPVDPVSFQGLAGRRIEGVGRRAKYLLVDVGGGRRLLLHLGMSGRVLVLARGDADGAHEHWRLRLSDGVDLAYRDPRRFGSARLTDEAEPKELRGLGPEPDDPALDGPFLKRALGRSRRHLKAGLLDQGVVAGIGNIYACEILFRAGISPTRRCHRVTREEWERLARTIPEVLGEAIEKRGTSFSDFHDTEGAPGGFQDLLAVFNREGEACRVCGEAIRRIPQGGRSSFLCRRCQR